jgi:cell division septation protein DedD
VPAADAEKPTVNETNASGDYRKELDFYSSLKGQKVDQNFHPETAQTTKQRRANESKADVARLAATQKAKLDGSGSLITLQVAALKSAPEADKLVKSLRSKGYPVFIVNPSREDANRLIRVQVGPYGSEAEAAKMKSRLGTDGYTAITKR